MQNKRGLARFELDMRLLAVLREMNTRRIEPTWDERRLRDHINRMRVVDYQYLVHSLEYLFHIRESIDYRRFHELANTVMRDHGRLLKLLEREYAMLPREVILEDLRREQEERCGGESWETKPKLLPTLIRMLGSN